MVEEGEEVELGLSATSSGGSKFTRSFKWEPEIAGLEFRKVRKVAFYSTAASFTFHPA
jgi:hypothetical protein